MREILFRGKRFDNNEWVYGSYLDENNLGIFTDDTEYEDCNIAIVEVNTETIGQYTGLTDKNGKKIFEGDILKYTRRNWLYSQSSKNATYFVAYLEMYYDDTCAAFKCRHYDENWKLIGGGFSPLNAEEIIVEVIGNIYDNTELLNKE